MNDKTNLLRIVGRGHQVVPDPQQRLAGRGAYLHPHFDCFEAACRRRVFARALRLSGDLDLQALADYLKNVHDRVNSP